jgi:small subunit ribosomal protein S6
MQKYTLTVLINEKVSETERNAIFESIKKDFGNLIKEDIWGVRSLAYEIKHSNKAFYAHFEFEAEPNSVITLDKNIRLNEDIVRYLIVKREETSNKKNRRKN